MTGSGGCGLVQVGGLSVSGESYGACWGRASRADAPPWRWAETPAWHDGFGTCWAARRETLLW